MIAARTLFLSILLPLSCAARAPTSGGPSILDEITILGAEDRAAAIEQIEATVGNANEADAPWVLLWAGEQRRLAGDDQQAQKWFAQLQNQFPSDRRKQGAILGNALIDAKTALSGNTLATLHMVPEDGVPDTMNADRYRLLARVAADDNAADSTVRPLVAKAMKYAAGDKTVQTRVRWSLEDLLEEQPGVSELPAEDGLTEDQRTLARAQKRLTEGDLQGAKKASERLIENWPESPLVRNADYILRMVEAGHVVEPQKTAVLLPLSGKWSPTGERLRSVVEMANDAAGGAMDLTFVDTEGDADIAVQRLEQEVIDQGAVAVLGPLLKQTAVPAAQAAEALGVPMVSLSQQPNVTEAGGHVFRGFVSMGEQIEALLAEAMELRQMERFAILYPHTSYGESARDLFATQVEANGGTIVEAIGYEADATDFLDVARKLGRKDSPDRTREWRDARRDAEDQGVDRHKVTIPPLADFDAIFIPDNHRRVPLVASALAYEEFSIGKFKARRTDDAIVLMGLNAWNHDALATAGGAYLRDCLFVDAFWPQAADDSIQRFQQHYKTNFGRPPLVVDAVTYDAARLLAVAMHEGGQSRPTAREALIAAAIEGPVAGGTSFSEERAVKRSFYVLTVGDDGIQQAVLPEHLDPDEIPIPVPLPQ